MSCASCVYLIETTLQKKDGIKMAAVALATNRTTVLYDPSQIGPRDIINIIEVTVTRCCNFMVCIVHTGMWTSDLNSLK